MLQIFAAAGTVLALAGCGGGSAGPRTTPPTAESTSSADRSLHSVGYMPIPVYWKAQNIWVADNHLCADPQTCEELRRVSASANGNTGNTAVEIYPASYPYPYGGVAVNGQTLWYTSNKHAVVDCTITNGGSCVQGNVIVGAATQLNFPQDVKLDPTGRPTIANTVGNSILTFDLGANGNVAPLRAIAGANTQLTFPQSIAYDRSGNLWVSQSNKLLEFGPGANGNVAPIRTIFGNQTGLTESNGIAVDRWGQVYVVDHSTNRLAMFKESGLGSNVSPDRVWSNPNLSHLSNPQYVAVDDYDIYVTNYGSNSISVLSIDPSAGNAAVATITGNGTIYPNGLALQ
jgi:hypothetical protein